MPPLTLALRRTSFRNVLPARRPEIVRGGCPLFTLLARIIHEGRCEAEGNARLGGGSQEFGREAYPLRYVDRQNSRTPVKAGI